MWQARSVKHRVSPVRWVSRVSRLLARQADRPFAELLRAYDAHHALVGRTVGVVGGDGAPPVVGRCEGMDDMGRLLLRARSTLHRVIAGQVVLR